MPEEELVTLESLMTPQQKLAFLYSHLGKNARQEFLWYVVDRRSQGVPDDRIVEELRAVSREYSILRGLDGPKGKIP